MNNDKRMDGLRGQGGSGIISNAGISAPPATSSSRSAVSEHIIVRAYSTEHAAVWVRAGRR